LVLGCRKITDKYAGIDGLHSWVDIWQFPALFAAIVLVLFLIFFKNEKIEYKD